MLNFSQTMSDHIWDAVKGDPTVAIQHFDSGYLSSTGPSGSSFKDRAKHVLIGASLGFLSVIGQVARLFAEIVLQQGCVWTATKKLAHTCVIIPAGAVLTVVFFAHYIAIELPKGAYRSLTA